MKWRGIGTWSGLVLASLLLACSSRVPRIGPTAQIWSDPTAVVGVAVAVLPVAAVYKDGQQGLLDMAINEAAAGDLAAHLETLDVSRFRQTADVVMAKLRARGLQTVKIEQPIDPAQFPERSAGGDGKQFADRDYSSLERSTGIQRLVLLRLASVGTTRSYFGFVPTSAPHGYARATGQMIDLQTGQLLWSAASTRRQDVIDEWDQPPSFPNVDRAIAEALRIVGKDLAGDLGF